MKIVVDTSVLIAVIADEPQKSALVNVTRGADLIAPHSIHWEIGNALSAMFKRKLITLSKAQQAITIYHTIPIQLVDVDLTRSVNLAHQLKIYAYDAYLIQCAAQYAAPLLTLDRNLRESAKQLKLDVVEVR